MKPDRFAQVKELVLKVADLSPEDRRSVLDRACRDDPDLRSEVESILAHDGKHPGILRTQAALMRELEATTPAASKVGKTIGHYRITEFRGEGGMGEVYRAEDIRLKRSVALKFIRRDLVAEERLKGRFIEEARAAAALDHPNICTVHAIEEWEGQLFLVMALIEGETLTGRIGRGPLELAEILAIAVQAATGLEAAHARGIVHRDIKSSNIMLSHDQRALIVDFGLARSVQGPEGADTHPLMGTPAYMSPEQSRGEPLDRRTDIWSLGVVLYEMITGRLPFVGESQREIIQAMRSTEPESCLALRPDTPVELERIVGRALAKKADQRYASAAELLADLQALRRKIDPIRRQQQRRLRLALITAGAVVAVMAGVVVHGIVVRRENVPLPHAQPRQVTSGDAWEGEPVLSPDGAWIAYTSDEAWTSHTHGEHLHGYVIDVRGGNPIRLTDLASSCDHPAWFPNGRDLAFVSEAQGESGIFRIPALGEGTGSADILLPHATDPAISPDGRRIAFARRGLSVDLRIWVASVGTPGDSVMLTHDGDGTWDHTDPAWSPDGRWICYAASRGLWIVPATGGAARPLTQYESDQEPIWGHDGRFVYFSSYREGTQAIWRIGVDGGLPQRLTIGTGPESHPGVSRDGAMLVYTTGMTGRKLLLVDRATGHQVRVPGVRNSAMAALSPDASSIVYQAERRNGRYDLWLQPLQNGRPSGDPHPLADHPGVPSHPVFSADGRWLAYYLIENDRRDIWVVSMTSGEAIRITDDPHQNQQPAWSSDGRALAFISERDGRSRIRVVAIDEGRPVGESIEIMTEDIDAFHPVWLPIGNAIAFVGRRRGEQEVWAVRADGSKPPYRITSGGSIMTVRWDALENNLLASGLWGGSTMTLRSVSLETGETAPLSPVVDFGSADSPGMFDVSADGRWIVYPSEEDKGDVWVLEAAKGSY